MWNKHRSAIHCDFKQNGKDLCHFSVNVTYVSNFILIIFAAKVEQ